MSYQTISCIAITLLFSLAGCVTDEELTDDDLDPDLAGEFEEQVNTGYSYVGIFSGRRTYCRPTTSTQGCRGFQSSYFKRYTDSNGNSCRDVVHRDGTARFGNRTFSATSNWYRTLVKDCR
jgi:hypothetical protein